MTRHSGKKESRIESNESSKMELLSFTHMNVVIAFASAFLSNIIFGLDDSSTHTDVYVHVNSK